MELYNDLNIYISHHEGGCTDVGTIKLIGYTLIRNEELVELIKQARLNTEGQYDE